MKSWALLSILSLSTQALEPSDLFLGMKEHSDQVKMMIGEELKYTSPGLALKKNLLKAKKQAFDLYDDGDGSGLGDIFNGFKSALTLNEESRYDPKLAAWQIRNFQTQMENYKSGNMSIAANHVGNAMVAASFTAYGAEIGATFGTAAGPLGTSVGAAGGAIIGYLATEVNNKYYDYVQQKELARMSNQMATVITAAVTKEEEYLLDNINAETLAEIDRKYDFQDTLNRISVCNDCTPEFEAHLRNGLMRNLTNLSKLNAAETKQLAERVEEVNEEVGQNSDRIVALDNRMNKLGNEMSKVADSMTILQETVDDLQGTVLEGQRQINEDLSNLSDSVTRNFNGIINNGRSINENRELIQKNSKDLKFVKDFTFSKMSPHEKLIALENGVYGENMKDEKKDLLLKQLKFQTNVGDFLNGARQVSQIASNLNINLGDFDEVIGVGQVAFNVVSSFLSPSPDYLGMAVQITGLFAKKRDIQGERHAQVMKALGVLNQKVDVVLENQQKLFEGQARILEGIAQVSAQIQEVGITLYDRIELVRFAVRTNRSGIHEGLRRSHIACNTFLSRLDKSFHNPLDMSPMRLREKHFSIYEDEYKNCKELTNTLDLIRQERKFSTVFWEIFNDNEDANVNDEYLNSHYFPLVKYYNHFTSKENKERDFLLGMSPFVNPVQLKKAFDDKRTLVASQKLLRKHQWLDNKGKKLNLDLLLKNPLDAKTALDVASNINRMAPYFDIIKRGKFPSVQELIKQEGVGRISVGYYALLDIQTLLEVSLIQKSFLSGQMIIPYMYEALLKGEKTPEIIKILKGYPNIRENFLPYFISNQLFNKENRDFYGENNRFGNPYERALKIKNSRFLKSTLSIDSIANTDVNCEEDKCSLKISEGEESVLIELISLNIKIGTGLLSVHPHSEKLLGMRDLTMNNIFGYSYEKNIESKNDKLNYRFMLFMGSPERPMKSHPAFEAGYNKI